MKKICVIGLGYMGLPTASLLATHGYTVVGFDINKEKIKKLSNGNIYIDEPGLRSLVGSAINSGRLRPLSKIQKSDIFLIAVPTPIDKVSRKSDLSYVEEAVKSVTKVLDKGNLVILESTVPVGTTEGLVSSILETGGFKIGKNLLLAYCPERALPGNTIYEIINNERIIGGINEESAKQAKKVYSSFVKGHIILTDIRTAEMVKLIENTFRDVNIALANELAILAEQLGVNIWRAIDLANLHPRVTIHKPGPGVGGHCLPIDPWFLTENTDNADLIRQAREVNDLMPYYVVEMIEEAVKEVKKPKITLLGAAYKANVDDSRESPTILIADLINKKGWELSVHDPLVKRFKYPIINKIEEAVKKSDCLVLIVNHDEYLYLEYSKIKQLMRHSNIIDTRNVLANKQLEKLGFAFRLLGDGKK